MKTKTTIAARLKELKKRHEEVWTAYNAEVNSIVSNSLYRESQTLLKEYNTLRHAYKEMNMTKKERAVKLAEIVETQAEIIKDLTVKELQELVLRGFPSYAAKTDDEVMQEWLELQTGVCGLSVL